jgi:hypothetical protein
MDRDKSNREKPNQQQPSQQNDKSKNSTTVFTKDSRGGGQPKPRTPSGEVKPWEPPKKETTPSNRKK